MSDMDHQASAPGGLVVPSSLSMRDGVITAAYDRDEDAKSAYDLIETGFAPSPQRKAWAFDYMSSKDQNGKSFWRHRERNGYYDTPLYAYPATEQEHQAVSGDMVGLVERAVQIVPLTYVNWHEAARAALNPTNKEPTK